MVTRKSYHHIDHCRKIATLLVNLPTCQIRLSWFRGNVSEKSWRLILLILYKKRIPWWMWLILPHRRSEGSAISSNYLLIQTLCESIHLVILYKGSPQHLISLNSLKLQTHSLWQWKPQSGIARYCRGSISRDA